MQTFTPESTQTSIQTTNAMIPANTRSNLASFANNAIKLVGLIFVIAFVIYVALVASLHHHLAAQAISITQASGSPAEVELVLSGFLPWLLSFALVPALIRLVLESVNPFRSTNSILNRLSLLAILGVGLALLPPGIRKLRGVDHAGLPVRMESSDPSRAIWWNPDGTPVLFHSVETNGSFRFWNRPGITPDTGLPCLPVTRDVRSRWEETIRKSTAETDRVRRQIAEGVAKITELSTLTDSLRKESLRREAETERLRRDRDAAERRARESAEHAERQALADRSRETAEFNKSIIELKPANTPDTKSATHQVSLRPSAKSSPAPSAWITRTLYPSGFLTARGAPNSRIEIRSNGHGLFHALGSQPIPFSGGTSSFRTSAPEFRLVGRESQSFLVTYRWIPQ